MQLSYVLDGVGVTGLWTSALFLGVATLALAAGVATVVPASPLNTAPQG